MPSMNDRGSQTPIEFGIYQSIDYATHHLVHPTVIAPMGITDHLPWDTSEWLEAVQVGLD